MTTPADADAPAPAHRDADSGWGTKIALGVVGFILVVEFVLPGFLAAGFSRATPTVFSIRGQVCWDYILDFKEPTSIQQAELYILAPSGWLMSHSHSIRRFYNWQYRLAGGYNDDMEYD